MRKFSPTIPVLVIYHGNCADGFTGAWAARYRLQNLTMPELQVEYYAGTYQDEPPECEGKDVVFIDFCYKLPVMQAIHQKAHSLTILDHHKSAMEDVWPWAATAQDIAGNLDKLEAIFDMERSGARIAWDYFNPGMQPPKVLLHVEDRDLWRFALEGTREIQAAVFSHPYDFDTWDKIMKTSTNHLRTEGVAIERKHFKDVNELLKVTQRWAVIDGKEVPVANLPYTMTSDAGTAMCGDGIPFAACYWDTPDGRVFSLRSRGEDGADVSAIAKKYGGGGHKNASGFRVRYEQIIDNGKLMTVLDHPFGEGK